MSGNCAVQDGAEAVQVSAHRVQVRRPAEEPLHPGGAVLVDINHENDVQDCGAGNTHWPLRLPAS